MAELIVALDVQTKQEAVEKVKQIGDAVGFYKIGLELYTAEGPDVVKAVKDLGKKVFLDLKFHDIPLRRYQYRPRPRSPLRSSSAHRSDRRLHQPLHRRC